jgi:hypothetical protein
MDGAFKRSLRSSTCVAYAVLFAIALGVASLRAETKVLRVDPKGTDPAVEKVHGPHLALYDPQVPSNHRLMVYFVGTGALAEGSLTIDSAFARLGYHVVALDYENNVLAASCVHSSDRSCFDSYRDAIVTGASGSEKIHVDRANSVLNRLQKFLVYLAKTDPTGGWDEFLVNGQAAWSRFVLAGHSQGSGHAAYIAKMYKVDKVLMFSGPQDYLGDRDEPAPWESRPSATPPSRFFAFLNINDPFNEYHQVMSCEALMQLSNPYTPMVEPGQTIQGIHQILVNDVDTKHAHGSTISSQFENVWDYFGTLDERGAGAAASPPSVEPGPGR